MIEIDGISFSYDRTQRDPLFLELSYTFASSQISAIVGPSGSGKSTLLYLLGLMLTPAEGRVLWDRESVADQSDGARSRLRAARVGFVFQDAALDPHRSVAENVAEGGLYAGMKRSLLRSRRQDLLTRLGVTLRDDHKPGEISGGQAQRVGLARAMIKTPDIVLADEPTGNLDAGAANVVLQTLESASETGATVVIATHDRRVSDIAQSVLEL